MVRTFLSVDISNKQIISNLSAIQQKLAGLGADIRLVNPQIIHLTLEFLGELSSTQIDVVKGIMDEIKFDNIKLKIVGIDVLPKREYIKVICCKVEGDIQKLQNIQKALRAKLGKEGFRTDNRNFKPHATIARVKSSRKKDELIGLINELSDADIGNQEIDSIKLKKSELRSDGPQYSILHEVYAEKANK